MSSHSNIPIPSDEVVTNACAEHNAVFELDSKAIHSLVTSYPSHTDLPDVLIKVATINQLYRTNIFGVHAVADTIVTNGPVLKHLLENGSCDAVDCIRITDHNGKKINHYSFATKYCHLHEPKMFPIFDSRVERALWRLHDKSEFCTAKQLRNIRDYLCFKEMLQLLRSRFSLSCSTLDLDRFLYIHGGD